MLKLKSHDWVITIIICALLFIGTVVVISTTINSTSEAQGAGSIPKQFIFVIIGLIVYFLLSLMDFSWLQAKSVLFGIYALIIGLLMYVKIFGTVIAGTNRWIDIGFFSFQPSEYAKIVLILITAAIFTINTNVIHEQAIKFVAGKGKRLHTNKSGSNIINRINEYLLEHDLVKKYVFSFIAAVPIIILTLVQPSLGNAVIISALWIVIVITLFPEQVKLMLFMLLTAIVILFLSMFFQIHREGYQLILELSAANINLLVAAGLLVSGIILALVSKIRPVFLIIMPLLAVFLFLGSVFAWNSLLTNYQKTRIDTFLEGPESDPLGTGYQVRQSKIAIGSGRLYGRGFLQGTQSNLNILTQAYTDFAFAALSEQFGFIGAAVVMLLYLILVLRVLKIGGEASSAFATTVCIGVAVLILLHVFINIGMNLGQLPVTGIPLPLISYGGSSVFVTLISLGIVQSISGSKRAVDISDTMMLRSRSATVY